MSPDTGAGSAGPGPAPPGGGGAIAAPTSADRAQAGLRRLRLDIPEGPVAEPLARAPSSSRSGRESSRSWATPRPAEATPRAAAALGGWAAPAPAVPLSPGAARKTKSRAWLGRGGSSASGSGSAAGSNGGGGGPPAGLLRHDSLQESKLLLVTRARRDAAAGAAAAPPPPSTAGADADAADVGAGAAPFQYHAEFEFLGVAGRTSASEVFKVRARGGGEVFAVKRARRRFRSKLQRERCLREVRAVAALPPHAAVVGVHAAWQEGGHFHIQMDWCGGGSLAAAARAAAAAGRALADDDIWAVAADVAAGLAHLARHGVLHLDVKPDNIFASLGGGAQQSQRPRWRIGDFGLAVARDEDAAPEGQPPRGDWEEGDGAYAAPELLGAGARPTPAADVFSLGASLYEVAAGARLPEALRQRLLLRGGDTARARDAALAALALPGRPPAMAALVRGMLAPDPAARPAAAAVVAYVARHAPGVVAAGAPAVAEEAARGAAQQQQQQQPARLGACAPEPSPFAASPALAGAPNEARAARPPAGAPGAALPPLAGAPGRRRGAASPSAKAAGPQSHPIRWAPDGGAAGGTPSAAAGLIGLTPEGPRAGGASGSGSGEVTSTAAAPGGGGAPLEARRPPPLRLPPAGSTGLQAQLTAGGGTARTDGPPSTFRLRRRDALSPGSDGGGARRRSALGSASDSEACSFSCDTGGEDASDVDLPDAALLSPTQLPRAGGGGSGGPTPAAPGRGTPAVGLPRPPSARGASGWAPAARPPPGDDAAARAPPSLGAGPSAPFGRELPRTISSVPPFPPLDGFDSEPPAPSPAPAPPAAAPGKAVPPLALGGVGAGAGAGAHAASAPKGLRRKRHHSRRSLAGNGSGGGSGDGAAAMASGRSLDLASGRSLDLGTSRSVREMMPPRQQARLHGGSFHHRGGGAGASGAAAAAAAAAGGDGLALLGAAAREIGALLLD